VAFHLWLGSWPIQMVFQRHLGCVNKRSGVSRDHAKRLKSAPRSIQICSRQDHPRARLSIWFVGVRPLWRHFVFLSVPISETADGDRLNRPNMMKSLNIKEYSQRFPVFWLSDFPLFDRNKELLKRSWLISINVELLWEMDEWRLFHTPHWMVLGFCRPGFRTWSSPWQYSGIFNTFYLNQIHNWHDLREVFIVLALTTVCLVLGNPWNDSATSHSEPTPR
jgi:hypothetical protein